MKYIAVYLLLVLFCFASTEAENNNANGTASKLPRGYAVISKDNGYATAIKLHKTEQTWNEARKRCFREGGFLAYATSQQEEKTFLKLMKTNKVIDIWIGIHDLFETGDFATILGEVASKVAYYKWRPDQPDNYGGDERCTHLRKRGLNDIACDEQMSYICKIKLRLPL